MSRMTERSSDQRTLSLGYDIATQSRAKRKPIKVTSNLYAVGLFFCMKLFCSMPSRMPKVVVHGKKQSTISQYPTRV